jgi:hypothetical protein
MPRKRKKIDRFQAVDILGEHSEPGIPENQYESTDDLGHLNLEDDDNEMSFYNVCACSKCASKKRPSVCLQSTIDRHIQKNGIAPKYEVSVFSLFLFSKCSNGGFVLGSCKGLLSTMAHRNVTRLILNMGRASRTCYDYFQGGM